MTDNEIIKALECCNKGTTADCAKCPKFNDDRTLSTEDCMEQLMRGGLALINRQKAEIERLKYNLEAVLDEKSDHSEAIKEFAERLHEKLATEMQVEYETADGFLRDFYEITETHIAINDLVKEMTDG